MRPLTIVLTSLAAVSAVAFGAYWPGQTSTSRVRGLPRQAESANTVESADGNANLAKVIGRLDRRLAALEHRQGDAKLVDPSAPDTPPTEGAAPPDLAEMRETQSRKAAAIEVTLSTEPRDRAWASATEDELRTAVDAAVEEGAQFSVETITCLTSICEVVLSASSPDLLQGAELRLVHRIAGMDSFDIGRPEAAPDGSGKVTYRMFRDGYPRPDEGM